MSETRKYVPGYENLAVWQRADELAIMIYRLTKSFPRDELFGLVSQMRRCAVSVPANIVEGYGRRTPKDRMQFYYIARGSLNELEYYLGLSLRLCYVSNRDHQSTSALQHEVGKLLTGFMKYVEA